jgi:hypothetical protein
MQHTVRPRVAPFRPAGSCAMVCAVGGGRNACSGARRTQRGFVSPRRWRRRRRLAAPRHEDERDRETECLARQFGRRWRERLRPRQRVDRRLIELRVTRAFGDPDVRQPSRAIDGKIDLRRPVEATRQRVGRIASLLLDLLDDADVPGGPRRGAGASAPAASPRRRRWVCHPARMPMRRASAQQARQAPRRTDAGKACRGLSCASRRDQALAQRDRDRLGAVDRAQLLKRHLRMGVHGAR